MSKHMICPSAKCCYYKQEDAQVIYCKGIVDNTSIHLAFANAVDAMEYKKKFCRNQYEECRIYKMQEEIENEEKKR